MAKTKVDLNQMLRFVDFTNKFHQLKRKIYATGENRMENDAEHSFQLSMVAWWLISSNNLKYDLDKVIRYTLVHDLVEIYAGDTFFYSDEESKKLKIAAEKESLKRIKKDFSEFKEMIKTIQQYEEKGDEETLFVYTLDKLIPVLNIYLDEGRSWKKHRITFEMLSKNKLSVMKNEDIKRIWEDVQDLLSENRHLFHITDN